MKNYLLPLLVVMTTIAFAALMIQPSMIYFLGQTVLLVALLVVKYQTETDSANDDRFYAEHEYLMSAVNELKSTIGSLKDENKDAAKTIAALVTKTDLLSTGRR